MAGGSATSARGGHAAGQGRSASRSQASAEEQVRPTTALRSLGLFIVILVAFAVLAPTLRHAVAQQEQLRRLRADVEAVELRNDELRAELERWDDPVFVQAQARDRLGYTMPGERVYRVIDPPAADEGEAGGEEALELSRLPEPSDMPWYLTVWDSIEIAGNAPAEIPEVQDEDSAGAAED